MDAVGDLKIGLKIRATEQVPALFTKSLSEKVLREVERPPWPDSPLYLARDDGESNGVDGGHPR